MIVQVPCKEVMVLTRQGGDEYGRIESHIGGTEVAGKSCFPGSFKDRQTSSGDW